MATLYRVGKGSVWVLNYYHVPGEPGGWDRVGPVEKEDEILDDGLNPVLMGFTDKWHYYTTDEP